MKAIGLPLQLLLSLDGKQNYSAPQEVYIRIFGTLDFWYSLSGVSVGGAGQGKYDVLRRANHQG
ncbi:MAG: hypothetical protein MJE77_26950 [Proteobacteria bacterium]|nr:hypothetical protein [Pseudomonadota bacterium]